MSSIKPSKFVPKQFVKTAQRHIQRQQTSSEKSFRFQTQTGNNSSQEYESSNEHRRWQKHDLHGYHLSNESKSNVSSFANPHRHYHTRTTNNGAFHGFNGHFTRGSNSSQTHHVKRFSEDAFSQSQQKARKCGHFFFQGYDEQLHSNINKSSFQNEHHREKNTKRYPDEIVDLTKDTETTSKPTWKNDFSKTEDIQTMKKCSKELIDFTKDTESAGTSFRTETSSFSKSEDFWSYPIPRNSAQRREYNIYGYKSEFQSNKNSRGSQGFFINNTERIQRNWIDITDESPQSAVSICGSDDTISVMSYNILSQKLLELNGHLYGKCDPNILPWEFRWKNLQQELKEYNVDVLCLQEVEHCHYFQDIKPWLETLGYSSVYKKRSGSSPNKPDGVLTAFRTDKFRLLKAIPVEYYRPNNPKTKWNNVGSVMVLQLSLIGSKPSMLVVGNTHLLYNPKRGDIKLTQLATFFAEIDRVLKELAITFGYQPPLVICGDFNSTPWSPLFQFITKGFLNYEGLTSKQISGQRSKGASHGLQPGLLPACLHVKDDCTYTTENDTTCNEDGSYIQHNLGQLNSTGSPHKENEATTTQDRGITVDYIFYSSNDICDISTHTVENSEANNSLNVKTSQKIQSLELKGHYSKPTGENIRNANSIPNSIHSSDHLPVIAKFRWKSLS
ncbi:protein angel homolog 2-like isoform X1 [Clavelina lepadiformis]|uniref:protein angel homolog 2-like isoform X1 n=1 Tax=Clavelina lepadiformis TaxID=159417 RepID=UPI0040412BC2